MAHVFQPRFLSPDKAVLSDTEVFVRLARGDASEQMRTATSISVGYMAENYVDLGFPGMLAGMFMIGLLVGGACRYFIGVEISLPKLFGAMVMSFIVYALLIKFVFPIALRWLDIRAALAQQLELRRQQARAAMHNPLLK